MLAVVNCRLIINVYTITKLMNINKIKCHSFGLLQSIPDKERLTLDYEKLGSTLGTVEEEWKAFKDAFIGVAEELCRKTPGRGVIIKKEKPNVVDRRSNKSNRRKERDMEDDRKDQGEWATTEYNITAPVRTEEGGQESRRQSKE